MSEMSTRWTKSRADALVPAGTLPGGAVVYAPIGETVYRYARDEDGLWWLERRLVDQIPGVAPHREMI